jgi:hypothetical protein
MLYNKLDKNTELVRSLGNNSDTFSQYSNLFMHLLYALHWELPWTSCFYFKITPLDLSFSSHKTMTMKDMEHHVESTESDTLDNALLLNGEKTEVLENVVVPKSMVKHLWDTYGMLGIVFLAAVGMTIMRSVDVVVCVKSCICDNCINELM